MKYILVLICAASVYSIAVDVDGVEIDTTPAPTLGEAAAQATCVFVGRVIRLDGESIVVLKVDKTYKGDVPDEVKLSRDYQAYNLEGWLEDLTYPFFIGKRYVVFASPGEELYTPYYSTNVQWTIAKVEDDKVNINKFRDHPESWIKLSKFGKEVKKHK
jgi:hypothetical protein